MNGAAPESRKDQVGGPTAAGLVLASLGILSSIWIPTLALILGIMTIVAGSLDLRRALGRRRRFARLTIGLGVATIVISVLVVIVTSGSSESAVSNI